MSGALKGLRLAVWLCPGQLCVCARYPIVPDGLSEKHLGYGHARDRKAMLNLASFRLVNLIASWNVAETGFPEVAPRVLEDTSRGCTSAPLTCLHLSRCSLVQCGLLVTGKLRMPQTFKRTSVEPCHSSREALLGTQGAPKRNGSGPCTDKA